MKNKLFGFLTLLIIGFFLSLQAPLKTVKATEINFPSIGEEYLKNNDFSNDLTLFSDVNEFNTTNFTNLMCTYTTNPTDCLSAGGAVQLQYDSFDGHLNVNDYPAIWQDVKVKKDTYYEWSIHVKRKGAADNGYLALGYRNPTAEDKWAAVSQNLYTDTTDEYQKISILIFTGTLESIRVAVHCQCKSTGKDGFYLLDDASLKEVDLESYIDTSSTAPTDCKIADFTNQYLNDVSFENVSVAPASNTYEKSRFWRSFSWAGVDKNGWGSDGSQANAFLTFNNNGLVAGERPCIGQDVVLKKNHYYVVSLYARVWNNSSLTSPLSVCFQDSNGVNSGTDNNTAMFKKNLDTVTFDHVGTNYEEYVGVLFTGDYIENRLVIYTTAVEHNGEINGYHIDNVRLWEVLTPEDAKLSIAAGFKIGKDVKPSITVKFSGKTDYVNIPMDNHVQTHYDVGTDEVFVSDLNNHLVPVKQGKVNIQCNLDVFGKRLTTNRLLINIGPSAENQNRYIQNIDASLAQNISTTSYSSINIDVFDSDGKLIFENELNTTVVAENPKVVYIRKLTTGPHAIGISRGSTRIYVTSQYEDSIGIGYIDVQVNTENLLIDGSFEAQNEYSFWQYSGTGGGSGDDGQLNIYRRSGYANLWAMSPIFWDRNAPKTAYADLGQYVDIEAGKYSLSVFINRYHANGIEGELSSNGGLVTLSATPVDTEGTPIGDSISREFDCSYGSFAYGKLSLVFDITTSGRFYINLHIQGDESFGYGMQIDDFELSKAIYPERIVAMLDETVKTLDVESIYSPYVYAIYADGTKEELTTDLRFYFDDFSICVYSNGYLFPLKDGETNLTVRANILDKQYESKIHIVVGNTNPTSKNSNLGLIIGLSSGIGIFLIGGSIATIFLLKKVKRK